MWAHSERGTAQHEGKARRKCGAARPNGPHCPEPGSPAHGVVTPTFSKGDPACQPILETPSQTWELSGDVCRCCPVPPGSLRMGAPAPSEGFSVLELLPSLDPPSLPAALGRLSCSGKSAGHSTEEALLVVHCYTI